MALKIRFLIAILKPYQTLCQSLLIAQSSLLVVGQGNAMSKSSATSGTCKSLAAIIFNVSQAHLAVVSFCDTQKNLQALLCNTLTENQFNIFEKKHTKGIPCK